MPRLPDIPIDLYTADQQAEFERQTNGLMPALTFQLAAKEHESQIPPDITLDATPETKHLELLNQQRQSELDLEAQHKAENSTQYQKYLDLLKQQEDARNAATQEAAQNGIPTPEDWTAQIHQDSNRPTGLPMDNASSVLYGAGTPESAPAATDANGLTGSDGLTPIGDTIRSGLGNIGSALGSGISATAENVKDSASAFGQHVGELAQGVQNLPETIKDTATDVYNAPQNIWQGTKDLLQNTGETIKSSSLATDAGQKVNDVGTAVQDEQAAAQARRDAGVEPFANPHLPASLVDRPILPEETTAQATTQKAAASVLGAPIKEIGDLADLLTGDPNQERRFKSPILDQLGMPEGVTLGQVAAQLPTPLKLLEIPQYLQVGQQLVEAPAPTAAGLALLGGLGRMASSPVGQKIALGIIGSIAGGIDAAINNKDVPTEAASAGLLGFAAPTVARDVLPGALKGAAKIIYDVAKAPTTRDILGYLDTLAGKVYDTATTSVSKFPGIADGLGANTTGDPAKTSLVDAAQNKLSVLDRIGALRDGTFDQFRALHTYLTQQGEEAGQRLQSITDVPTVLEEERQKVMSILKSPVEDTTRPWNIVDATGQPVRKFATEAEANSYIDAYPDQGWNVRHADQVSPYATEPSPPGWGSADAGASTDPGESADMFKTLAAATLPRRAMQGSVGGVAAGVVTGGPVGAAAGYLSAPDDAPMSEKLDRASKGWLIGAATGAPLGAYTGLAAAYSSSKLFEAAIRSGKISSDLFFSHPDDAFRVPMLMLLAARDKADNELVHVPDMIRMFQKADPTSELPFQPMTAGEIRAKYGNLDLNVLGRTVRNMLGDYFTDFGAGAQQGKEIGADLAAANNRLTPGVVSGAPRATQVASVDTLSSKTGMNLTQATPNGTGSELWNQLNDLANQYGIRPPRVFINEDQSVNAAAYRGTASAPVIIVSRGAVEHLTPEEMNAVVLHELAHATDSDLGHGLVQQVRDIVGMGQRALTQDSSEAITPISQRARQGIDALHSVIPTQLVDKMTSIPVKQITDPRLATPPEWKPFPGSSNAAGALAGGAIGSQQQDENDPDNPDNNGLTFGKIAAGALIGGVLWGGRKKALPDFITNDSKYAMFGKPKPDGRLITAGPIESAYNWWTSHVTDSLERLQGYQNDIAKEFKRQIGMAIPASTLAAELKRFDADGRARVFIDQNLKPAIVAFRNLGIDDQMVDSYLAHTQDLDIAKHQGNYDNTGQYANRVFPSGNFAVDSEKYLAKTDAWIRNQNTVPNPATGIVENSWFTPEQQKQFYGAVKQVWDTGDKILQWKRDSGLITADAYNQLRQVFPHYVPTNIVAYIGDAGNVAVGKSLSVTSNTIKALSHQGTEKTALGPLASLVSATYEASRAAQKNQVFNAFVNMWQEASRLAPNTLQEGSSALWNSRSSGRVRDFADLVQLMPTHQNVAAGDKTWQPLEGFMDGVKLRFAVHKDLGAVTKFDSPSNIPILSGMMAAFRAGATSRNPVFLASNLALDAANYMIRETARSGNPWTPAKNYAETLATILLNPRVWIDMGKNELRGNEARFNAGGGGYAGHTPQSNYIPNRQFNPDPNQAGWLESTVGQIVEKLHGSPMSESQREVQRLGRDVGYRTGAGALAGAVAGGYAGNLATPDNATPAERVEKVFGGGAAGAIAGGHLVGRMEARSVADVNRILGDLFTLKPVERIGEHIEAIPRVAAMKNAEERYAGPISDLNAQIAAKVTEQARYHPDSPEYQQAGMEAARLQSRLDDTTERGRIEAIQSGRTTTIDFNKGGTWAKAINQVVPFFNVNVQSAADMPRMWKENPVAATTVLASLVLPSVAAEAINNRNEQTRKDYDDVPQYVKDQGLVIMLPNERDGAKVPVDENGNRHPQYITIRYRQFAPIAVASRELLQATLFRDPTSTVSRSFLDSMFSMAQGVSPVPSNSAGDFLTNLTSPIVGTATQLAFNKDTFRNRDIMTKGADEHASPLSQELARRLGGNSDTMGRPSWWEFASRDLLTGRAGMWHGLSDIVAGKPKGGDPQIADTPVVGALASRWVKGSIGEEANVARVSLLTPSAHQILKDNNIEWRPTPSNPAIGDVDLTQREYADYQRTLNQVTDKAIHDMPNDPRWNTWTRLEKENAIKNAVDQDKAHATSVWYQANITPEQRKQRIQHAIEMEKITPNRSVRR